MKFKYTVLIYNSAAQKEIKMGYVAPGFKVLKASGLEACEDEVWYPDDEAWTLFIHGNFHSYLFAL
jgi:hypothetical protein